MPPVPAPMLSAAILRARAACRTHALDRLLRAWSQSTPDLDSAAADLVSDLQARLRYWALAPYPTNADGSLRLPAFAWMPGRRAATYQHLGKIAAVQLAVLLALGFFAPRTWAFNLLLILATTAFLATVGGAFTHVLTAIDRARFDAIDPPQEWISRAFTRRLCPDCAYDLASLPDAIPPEPLAGLHVGPAHCPECGASWPLIPPPPPTGP